MCHQLWFFSEIGDCFENLAEDSACRAIVLSGKGKGFCAGIDLSDLVELSSVVNDETIDTARKAKKLQKLVLEFQDDFTAIERVRGGNFHFKIILVFSK